MPTHPRFIHAAYLLALAALLGAGPVLAGPVYRVHLPVISIFSQTAVLVGAGDIADCATNWDEQTADLVSGIPGTVFTLGDNVYENGTPDEFQNCYAPSWGRFSDRPRPAPGNHDYNTLAAAGYFGYFGAAAHPVEGYYSYERGGWHILALNSNCDEIGG